MVWRCARMAGCWSRLAASTRSRRHPSAAGDKSMQALIPTGWYPSAVATEFQRRTRVFVANRKSPPAPIRSAAHRRSPNYRNQPNACGAANQYIWQLEKAGLLDFPLPDARLRSPRPRSRSRRTSAFPVQPSAPLPCGEWRRSADASSTSSSSSRRTAPTTRCSATSMSATAIRTSRSSAERSVAQPPPARPSVRRRSIISMIPVRSPRPAGPGPPLPARPTCSRRAFPVIYARPRAAV